MNIVAFVKTELKKTHNRVVNMIARGVVTLVNDAMQTQEVQATLLAGEVQDLQRLQNYGFTTSPPIGSECVTIFVGASRSHGVVLAVEEKAARRAALDNVTEVTGLPPGPGDVLIYTTSTNFILMRAAGNIIIHSPETIRFDAKVIELHAIEKIKWDVNGTGYDFYQTVLDLYNTCQVPNINACMPPEHGTPPAQ